MILLQAHLDTTAVPCPPYVSSVASTFHLQPSYAQDRRTGTSTVLDPPQYFSKQPIANHPQSLPGPETPRHRDAASSPFPFPSPDPLPCSAYPIPHPCTVESRLGPGPSFSTDKGRQTSLLLLPLPLGPDQACHVAGAVGAMGESCACDKAGARGGQVGDANGDVVAHCTLHTRSSRADKQNQASSQASRSSTLRSIIQRLGLLVGDHDEGVLSRCKR
jgi:hypothetical protein